MKIYLVICKYEEFQISNDYLEKEKIIRCFLKEEDAKKFIDEKGEEIGFNLAGYEDYKFEVKEFEVYEEFNKYI